MLIPDLTLTYALIERLRACGDDAPLEPYDCAEGGLELLHLNGSELTETEQRRVVGVLAAHRVQPFDSVVTYETFDSDGRIQGGYSRPEQAVDDDDACAILRAELRDYPEYAGRDFYVRRRS